ncbi:dynamin family protein [Endozoicomonas sp.]|uniref:dynamin family protein n=1 Tax=Endozoicomonas sp. TaxID=1892382 RepID=UPI00383AED3C
MHYKTQYDERKNSVLTLLNQAREFYQSTDKIENEQAFEALHTQVENGEFTIVVVGEFSAGKSTFLNALMGDKYLPSFSGETTATVNFLAHKDKAPEGNGLRVVYNDGSTKSFAEASFENVEKFSTTKGEEDVAQNISHVDLFLESDFLKNDVILVDSPGLNGVREGHRKITEDQIKKSHACIFLFNAQQPGKNSDFDFLEQLKSEVSTVLLVLNKIDTINQEEESIDSVMGVLGNSYQTKFPEVTTMPEIWPLAAFNAMVARSDKTLGAKDYTADEKKVLLQNSQFEAFEQRLWRFLTQGEKARTELLEPVNRVVSLLNRSFKDNELLIIELQDSKNKAEVHEQITALEAQLEKLNVTVQDKKRTIKKKVRQCRSSAENTLSGNLENVRENFLAKFDRDFIKNSDRLLMDDALNKTLVRFLKRVDEEINRNISSVSRSFQAELECSIQSVIDGEVADLNEEFAKLTKPIELAHSCELDQYNFSLDFSELEKRRVALEGEIAIIEERLSEAEKEEINAIKLEEKMASLQSRLVSLENQKINTLIGKGTAPGVERHTSYKDVKESRDGVLGWVAEKLVGKKRIKVDVIVEHDHRQKQYEKDIESINADFSEKISAVANELKHCDKQDSISSGQDQKRLSKQLSVLEDNKKRETEVFNQKQQKHFTSQLSKLQEEIEEQIDFIRREAASEVSVRLKDQESALVPLLLANLEAHLSDKLIRKNEDLKFKKIELESSVSEREEKVDYYQQQNRKIKEILMQAIELEADLNAIEADQVKQHSIIPSLELVAS